MSYRQDKPAASELTLTVADGFCYNSEPGNKQAYPATCDQQPKSCTYSMSYTVTTVQVLSDLLKTAVEFSPCLDAGNATFIHGSYGLGRNPQGSILVDPSGVRTLRFLHQGLDPSYPVPLASKVCGLPIPYKGHIFGSLVLN